MHGVMTLLAGLEMSRRRELFLRQVAPFSELWLYRRAEGDEEPAIEGRATGEEEPEVPRGVRRRPAWMKPEEPETHDPLASLDDGAEGANAEPVVAESHPTPMEQETT